MILDSIKLRYVFESRRRAFFLALDALIAAFSYLAAFLLRFEGKIPPEHFIGLITMLPFVVVLRAICFVYFGLYQTLWQYLGIQELIAIVKASTVGTLLIPLIPFFFNLDYQPRSTLIIDWILLNGMLGGTRVLFKMTAEKLRKPHLSQKKNVLIIGAGDTGELLAREFIKRPGLGYRAIGFLDSDPQKIGIRIHGVKVLGKSSQLAQVARVKKLDEVIIALSQASGGEIKEIVHQCRDLHVVCRIVPQTSSLLSPQILPTRLRPVDISDILGRDLVQIDLAGIQDFFRDKRVIITGAGGSIGSELAKTLYQTHASELVLIDNSENNLYEIETDLQRKPSEIEIKGYMADVTHAEEMEKIIQKHKPHVIYHAAAHKQVPLVENHFNQGILNNVLGTKTVADLALQYKIQSFVLISTDKAIRPKSIMGATKRIAELYIQSLNGAETRFLAVRFGNVFDSKGSVVPLFKKQIAEGGPITITHPNVTRYFMDISEAVFLILQATTLGSDSEIFVLDMGEPVKIFDLANSLIQLMGFTPNSIPIQFTGLRPGEKLVEELRLDGEQAVPTKHKKIKIWKSEANRRNDITREVETLIQLTHQGASRDVIVRKLKEIVSEYEPWNPIGF